MSDFNTIYYRARQTCLEMFVDRGYTVPPHLQQLTPKEFEIMFDKNQMDLSGISDQSNRMVYVKIINPSSIFNKKENHTQVFDEVAKYFSSKANEPNNESLKSITDGKSLEIALDKGICRLIIIYNARQQENSQQKQNKHEEKYLTHKYIEVYPVHNFINPKNSKYQPKFKLITDIDEIAKIYRQYDAKPIMLGSICIDDPINRYYGGRPAEDGKLANLYEITRGGVNIFYRKVMPKLMNL